MTIMTTLFLVLDTHFKSKYSNINSDISLFLRNKDSKDWELVVSVKEGDMGVEYSGALQQALQLNHPSGYPM